MRSFLWKNQLVDQDFFDSLEQESEALAVRLREGCRALPDPDPLSIFDDVYAEDHPLVNEERETFAAYLASFADAPDAGAHA